jgi:GTP cyclohydrolase I
VYNFGVGCVSQPQFGRPFRAHRDGARQGARQGIDLRKHAEYHRESRGEDPEREGLVRTPDRAEKALRYLTSGYQMDIGQIVNGALFTHKCDEMIVVRDIEFFSMCEHHLLPFFGKVHVAYLPDKRVIGLSKIPRIVDAYPDFRSSEGF